MKDKSNPKILTTTYGGCSTKHARNKASAGRMIYKDGKQAEYKSGEMPKCMPK